MTTHERLPPCQAMWARTDPHRHRSRGALTAVESDMSRNPRPRASTPWGACPGQHHGVDVSVRSWLQPSVRVTGLATAGCERPMSVGIAERRTGHDAATDDLLASATTGDDRCALTRVELG